MGQACDEMNKRLAGRIAERKSEHYPLVINHVRTRLRFSLLRGILVSLKLENEDQVLNNVTGMQGIAIYITFHSI